MTTATISPEALSQSLLSRYQNLQNNLATLIQQLPDNPSITRIGGANSKIFTIQYSQLQRKSCLSPFFYDYKTQYQQIAELIKFIPLNRLERFIGEICSSSAYHDDVKRNLINLWKGSETYEETL